VVPGLVWHRLISGMLRRGRAGHVVPGLVWHGLVGGEEASVAGPGEELLIQLIVHPPGHHLPKKFKSLKTLWYLPELNKSL